MSKYTREEKLEMLRLYKEEKRSINQIADRYGISPSYLRHLLTLDAEGKTDDIGRGQARREKNHYSGMFKLRVVKEKLDSGLGYREIARKYGINHTVLMSWERIYLLDGEKGLLEERRGKTVKEGYKTKKDVRHNLDKKIEQDLIAEVQQLRMENEYLKKLQALAQAEERSGSKQK